MFSFGRVQSQTNDYRLIQALHFDRPNGWLNHDYHDYVVLQERQHPSETSEGLTQNMHILRYKPIISDLRI